VGGDGFGEYLAALPEELLEHVSEDYVWLARLGFREKCAAEFVRRRECCRAECLRRGQPGIYRLAEWSVAA
jgi:hypothetical protein